MKFQSYLNQLLKEARHMIFFVVKYWNF